MRTFDRYFIHFFTISMFIFCTFMVLVVVDNTIKLNPVLLWIGFFCVLIFTIPMTIFFNSQAKVTQISIAKQMDGDTLNKLNSLILNKLNRKIKVTDGNQTTYQMSGKYNQWLTSPVKTIEDKEYITIILPKAYEEIIVKEFVKYK